VEARQRAVSRANMAKTPVPVMPAGTDQPATPPPGQAPAQPAPQPAQ
jgi:hypothetical protein